MIFIPSSRRAAYPALGLLVFCTVVSILNGFRSISIDTFVYPFARRQFSARNRVVELTMTTNNVPPLAHHFLSEYHSSNPVLPGNPIVVDLLSQCRQKPHPRTNHIRFTTVPILNVSMVPSLPNVNADEFRDKSYFNPAIIPLPSYVTTTIGRYLLVTRLVTDGAYQESHICFAEICTPSSSSPPRPGERACTYEDLDLLGEQGGMRCVSRPEKVNIPPTPARQCEGSWRHFVDIPGFHDPRVFWSGRGEPMIEVNSGSQYGCVGLWVQDLRSVYPTLDDVLLRRPKTSKKRGSDEEGTKDNQQVDVKADKNALLDLRGIGVPVGYPYLTELTRNPKNDRNLIEKNWVLFFPNEDEAYVQYDMMGKLVKSRHDTESSIISSPEHNDPGSVFTQKSSSVPMLMLAGFNSTQNNGLIHGFGLGKRASQPSHTTSADVTFESQKLSTIDLAPSTPSRHANHSTMALLTSGGRTIAQLLSHGYTTPNLTSPFELSCFDLTSFAHAHDAVNNTGHWHQGSNSLRLVTCNHEQFRARACLRALEDNLSLGQQHRQHDTMNPNEYEDMLRQEGMVLHISVVHRKFSNPWELPMRYERYFLLWEARKPFRILAISQYPVLFDGERARPWSWEDDVRAGGEAVESQRVRRGEDIGDSASPTDGRGASESVEFAVSESKGQEHEIGRAFTYTPSIAWTWRPRDEDEQIHRIRGHEDLGAGYLDDEIIVGVGVDDVAQGFAKVKVAEVLDCMRICPGV